MEKKALPSTRPEKKKHLEQRCCRIGFLGAICTHLGLFFIVVIGAFAAAPEVVAPSDAPIAINLVAVKKEAKPTPPPLKSEPQPIVPEPQPQPVKKEVKPSPPVPQIEPNPIVKKPSKKVTTPVKKTGLKPVVSKARPKKTTLPANVVTAKKKPTQSLRTAAQVRQTLLSYLVYQVEKYKHYPPAARRLSLEGKVDITVRVDTSGGITSINISQNGIHPILYKATQKTMRKVRQTWKKQPSPQAMTLVVPLRFSL